MSEVIVITSGKGGVGKTTTSATGEESGADRYRYRPQEPGRGDGTGKPHCLQPGRRGGGKLSDEAGADKRQKIS